MDRVVRFILIKIKKNNFKRIGKLQEVERVIVLDRTGENGIDNLAMA